ncbi:MAG: tyrosine-type recombinase/integrase [Pirellulales bacterium]
MEKKSLYEAAGKKKPKKLIGPQPFFRAFNRQWYLQLGKRQFKLGADPEQALQLFYELMANRKDVEATSSSTVCEVLDDFLQWVKDWREEGTFRWYRNHLRDFRSFIGDSLRLLDLREHHVTNWVDKRHKESSPDTIYGAIRSVQRAMNWAVKRGYLPRSPVKGVEKPQQQPREAVITPEQFEQIISRCRDQEARDLFATLWETGCRVQEIRQVEGKHFNEADRCWLFPRKQAKGKRAARVVYLTDTAFEITKRLAEQHPEGPIFRNRDGKPWTKNAIVLRFTKIARPKRHACAFCGHNSVAYVRGPHVPAAHKNGRKRVCVCKSCIDKKRLTKPTLGKINLPIPGLDPAACATSFRHSFITRALKNRVAGITVSVLCGHSDTRMISRVYSHLEQDPEFLMQELAKATS